MAPYETPVSTSLPIMAASSSILFGRAWASGRQTSSISSGRKSLRKMWESAGRFTWAGDFFAISIRFPDGARIAARLACTAKDASAWRKARGVCSGLSMQVLFLAMRGQVIAVDVVAQGLRPGAGFFAKKCAQLVVIQYGKGRTSRLLRPLA